MMRSTRLTCGQATITNIRTNASFVSAPLLDINVVEQPYYLKPVPMNPYFGTVHDGVSSEYGRGFSVKPIHHLYRFTHNVLPLNIPRGGNRAPISKRVHWLESSFVSKCYSRYWNWEFVPPGVLGLVVVIVCCLHLIRFIIWSPDISWYNLAFPTNKNFVQFVRFNQAHPMDQPIYRYLQQSSEFYFLDIHKRGLIENNLIANDPFIEHVKEIGRGDELLATLSRNAPASEYPVKKVLGGRGGTGNLVPSVFQEKSSWWTPRDEQLHNDYEKGFADYYGNAGGFWSLYTNLVRY